MNYAIARDSFVGLRSLELGKKVKLASLLVSSAVTGALSPLILAHFIGLSENLDRLDLLALTIVAAFFLLRLIEVILTNLRWIVINPVLYEMSYSYAGRISEQISDSYTQHKSTLDLTAAETSHVVSLVQTAQNAFMNTCYSILAVIFPTSLSLVFVIIIIFSQLGFYAFLLFIVGAFLSFASMFWAREIERIKFQSAIEADISVYAKVGEFVTNGQLVTQYGARVFLGERLAKGISSSLDKHYTFFQQKCKNEFVRSSFGFVTYLTVMGIVVFGGIGPGLSKAADIFLIFAYLDRMSDPLLDLANAIIAIRNNEASQTLIQKFLSSPRRANEGIDVDAEIVREVIQVINAKSGTPGPQAVFRVVGESGSGKTTFLRRLVAEIEASCSGGLTLCNLASVVPIVGGTILENAILRSADEGRELEPAADLIQTYLDEILQNDVKTRRIEVGSDVNHLSGGELQVLGIVRAVVRRPDIIILDEATSQMDVNLERNAIRFLVSHLSQSVVLIVSHRGDLGVDFGTTIHIDRKGPAYSH